MDLTASDVNFGNLLSLDKAKLRNRLRKNWLGTKELTIVYNKVNLATHELALEWLWDNRPTVTDPKFGFKTYKGTWYTVDTSYDDRNGTVSQRVSIDGVFENDVGDKSAGLTSYRSYYPKIVDPNAYNIPTSIDDGDVWNKRVQDNGDGTFDVIIVKETAVNLTATSYSKSSFFDEVVVVNTNSTEQMFVSNGGSIDDPIDGELKTIRNDPLENGKFRTTITTRSSQSQTGSGGIQSGASESDDYPGSYTETSETNTSGTEIDFVSNGGSVPDATVGEIKRIENIPNEDGSFRTVITTRTAIAQRMPPVSADRTGDYPWLEYGSDYIQDANNIIVGKNQTWDDFLADRDRTQVSPAIFKINSISARVNEYGLFDYTIVSNTPG